MPRSPRSRFLAGTFTAALALGGLAACGDDDGDDDAEAPEATFEGLLALVPDTEGNRELVVIQRFDVAAEGMEATEAKGSEEDLELSRLGQFTIQRGLGPVALVGGIRAAKVYGDLGFRPSDVRANVAAGSPPNVLEVALVDADREAVLEAAASAVDGAERREIEGENAVTWLDDGEVAMGIETPVGGLPGQAARLAWVAPGALAWSTTDPVMASAVTTADDRIDALADDDAFDDVADALDDANAYAASIVGSPLSSDPQLTPEQREASGDGLDPYLALAVGGTWDDDGLGLMIVLAHADDAAAEANEKALAEGIAEGRSARTSLPWSEMLADPDVTRDGSVVIGRFSVESPRLWLDLIVAAEPLLAVG